MGQRRRLTPRSSADAPRQAGLAALQPRSSCFRTAKPSCRGSRLNSNVRRHSCTNMRTVAAFTLAITGTLAVYAGSLVNVAVLGTIGDALIVPGIVLLAVSTAPLCALSTSKLRYGLHLLIRYLSLPVFCLGVATLIPAWTSRFTAASGKVIGLEWASFITLAGLLAVTWPEVTRLFGQPERHRATSQAQVDRITHQDQRSDA